MADAGLSDADVAAMNKGWFETMTAVRDKLRAVGKVRSAYPCGSVVGCLHISIRICICCGCLCLRRRLRLLPVAWPVLVPRSSSARLKSPHEHASSPSPAAALSVLLRLKSTFSVLRAVPGRVGELPLHPEQHTLLLGKPHTIPCRGLNSVLPTTTMAGMAIMRR